MVCAGIRWHMFMLAHGMAKKYLKHFLCMVYTLSKHYAHVEYVKGMLDVRCSQVKYACCTWTYSGNVILPCV